MSLIIGEKNSISMIRGDTASISVKMRTTEGEPIPFVPGDKVYFTIKQSTETVEKVLQKCVTEFLDGVAFVNIEHDDTKLQATGVYVYDIQVNLIADSSVTTIIPPSRFELKREVTYE